MQRWKCLTCTKEFEPGQWTCSDGVNNHLVAEKTYRSLDAPLDPGHPADGSMDSLRDGRTRVCNIPPPKKVMRDGEVSYVGEGYVEFVRGLYSTTDPEKQYWLDKKGVAYNATEQQWQAVWLSTNQQLQIAQAQLAADRMRLENDRNELLAQQKKVRTAS